MPPCDENAESDAWPRAAKPSPFVRKCLDRLGQLRGIRALDAGCGFGRHSILLAEYGYDVVAADIDAPSLGYLKAALQTRTDLRHRVRCVLTDCEKPQAFSNGSFGLAVIADMIDQSVLENVGRWLAADGYLIYQTVGAHGGNWVSLPQTGSIEVLLYRDYDLLMYREKPAGPEAARVATVRCLARRRDQKCSTNAVP